MGAQHTEEEEPDFVAPKRGAFFVLRRTVREFLDDQGPDNAAALTYFGVLAVFPAALALLAILGLVGEAQRAIDKILEVIGPMVSSDTVDRLRGILETLTTSRGAGLTLIVAVVIALYSASGYIAAFTRAMNRVYEVEEGRALWRLKPAQLMQTLVLLLLCVAGLVILVVSGPLADSIGSTFGLGSQTVQVWNIAKWPVLLLIVVLAVAMLYHFTPNVKFGRFRWISWGACVAILVWILASAGFAFYVANFSSYNKTYGSLAGAIIALLWLWITNLALLFGAELESELERGRELQDGLPAEENLQLPLRSDKGIKKSLQSKEKLVAKDRAIREAVTGGGELGDRPFSRRR